MAKELQLFVVCFVAMIAASCNTQPKESERKAQQVAVTKPTDSVVAPTVNSLPKDSLTSVAKVDSAAWIDSLDAIVKKNYPNDSYGDKRYEKHLLSFTKASNTLGDYYLRQYRSGKTSCLNKAMEYYEPTTFINDHADYGQSLKEKLKACKQVALLYDAHILPISKLDNIYIGHFINPEKIALSSTFNGDLTDSTGPCIRYIVGNRKLTQSAKKVLNAVTVSINQHPGEKVVISSGGADSEAMQQVLWEQTWSVIEYLMEKRKIERERFIFRYVGPEKPGYTTIRFAKEGENGESIVAPPHPGIMDGIYK